MSFIDKTPLKSKKFIFAILAVIILSGIILTTIFIQTITWPLALVLTIIALGLIVIPVGYVLGQAAIDKVAAMVQSVSGAFGGKNDSDSEDNLE